jgi:ribosomal protein S18 acetylase RimI-like enzyme
MGRPLAGKEGTKEAMMGQGAEVQVRPLREEDLEDVVRIARKVTRDEDEGFWRGLLRAYLLGEEHLPDALSPSLCQVAVGTDRVVGFMIGDVQSWQFGIPRCGRILAVGVDPEQRRSGVATRLAEAFFEQFRRLRVPFIQCQVLPGDPLGDFFEKSGFRKSEWITLTRDL